MHRFVLQYQKEISRRKNEQIGDFFAKQTSISSFFFNNCANSARVSRKVGLFAVFSLFAVGLVGDVVAVGVVGVESFISVRRFSFFNSKQKISSREMFEEIEILFCLCICVYDIGFFFLKRYKSSRRRHKIR